jgi:integrase
LKWHNTKEELMNVDRRAPSYVPKLGTYRRLFFEPCYGNRDIRTIFNLDEFTQYLSTYRKKDGKPLSLKYQKNLVDALKGFFRWALRKKYISELPDFPDAIEVPEHDPRTICKDTQRKILECVPDEHKPIFTWLFWQGCRPGEVRALLGDCIITDREPRDVVKYCRGFSGSQLKEYTKTKKIRYNYIYPEARTMLPEFLHRDRFVFTHGAVIRHPYSAAYLNRIYRKALQEFNNRFGATLQIELYEASKHSFGTQKINEGKVSIYDLKEWYGHTKIDTTEKYAKLNIVDVFRRDDKAIPIEQGRKALGKDRQ